MKTRLYSELIRFDTFLDRFEYLKLGGQVGVTTFGFDRYLGQTFYRSREWKMVRDEVIVRDEGCDLGVPEYPVFGRLLVHHINPVQVDDLKEFDDWVLNPEYLITTSHRTHNAIHYGDNTLLPRELTPRKAGDTSLW